jgi:transcriptional regulator with AAA-type ATPase domain
VSLAPPDVEVLERLVTRLVGRFRLPGAATTGEFRAIPREEPILPLAEVEKRAFLSALEKLGSVAKAAEALGVSKVTFYAKLRSWGMHPKDAPSEDRVSQPPPSRQKLGVADRDRDK